MHQLLDLAKTPSLREFELIEEGVFEREPES